MKRIASTGSWVIVLLGFLLALWLPLMASVHYLEMKAERDIAKPMWLSRSETLRLMRHHGTIGLKVTDDRVYIWRDSRWIPVLKRGRA